MRLLAVACWSMGIFLLGGRLRLSLLDIDRVCLGSIRVRSGFWWHLALVLVVPVYTICVMIFLVLSLALLT